MPRIGGTRSGIPVADLARMLREREQSMTDDERVEELCLFLEEEPDNRATRRRIRRRRVAGASTVKKAEDLLDLFDAAYPGSVTVGILDGGKARVAYLPASRARMTPRA